MKSSYKRNIVYNSIYRIIVIITPLITSPYLSRVLGATNIGIYTYCYAFAVYFVIFALLGVNDYGNRTIAKCKKDFENLSDCFWQIYYLQAALSIICLIIYILLVTFFINDYYSIRLILIAHVISGMLDINWFAFGLEEFKFTSIRNIIIRLGIVISILLFVKSENDLGIYAAILVLGNLISTFPIWFLVVKKTKIVKPSLKKMIFHFKPNLVLFLPVIATTIYQQIDKIMLGSASMTSEVGYYQNAENIVTLPTFLTTAIVTVMLPHISKMLINNNKDSSISLLQKSLYYTTILNIAMTFGLMSIADVFIPWFLGKGYERSAELVKIISPIIAIGGISSIVRYEYLVPNEYDKTFTVSIILGAITNVLLNMLLIPHYLANGAAVATVISYLVVHIYQMFFSYKDVKYNSFFKSMVPYVLLGLVMSILINLFNILFNLSGIKAVLLSIFIGIVVYFSGTLLIMMISRDELFIKIKNSLCTNKGKK